jgi:recombination protein RecT
MPRGTTVSQAVAQREPDNGPKSIVKQYAGSFGRVLPEHLKQDTFVALANAYLARDGDLRQAAQESPETFIHALMDCATLGHRPGHNYALTVRTLKGGKKVVLGIEEYTGKIERMYRAGRVRTVKAEVVRAKDEYRFDRDVMDVPVHRFIPFATFAERGPLIGVYAYAVLYDGSTSRVVELNKDQVMASRDLATMKTIWDDPIRGQDMWLKTALHVLEKFVPTSPEYMAQQLVAQAARAEETQHLPPAPVDYTIPDYNGGAVIDGEEVDTGPPAGETGGAWPTVPPIPGQATT